MISMAYFGCEVDDLQCKHFGSCGSCSLYDIPYSEQLVEKEQRVSALLAPFYLDTLSVFDSPQSHYRARAEFRIWHAGEVCHYAMGNLSKNGAVTITQCPKVIQPIEECMWRLLEQINASKELSHRLFGVEFLATDSGECLVTMLYHRRLEEAWSEVATPLEELLDIKLIGRSRKQKVVLSQTYVTESLTIEEIVYKYRHYEGGFTQPNPEVNVKMIEWVISRIEGDERSDLLESYCGLGNFTIPLSKRFTKVLATEISKNSIHAAKENCGLNGVEYIAFVRLSSEEMTQALNGVRAFRRLEGVDLASYAFTHVLVDPPRAGLDADTIALISQIDTIIYISCNPETLARDLESLSQTHTVSDAALFDQFPHTTHVESGVILRRKI